MSNSLTDVQRGGMSIQESPLTQLPRSTRLRMTGRHSGGTYLDCAWHQGCSATFYGSPYTNTEGARYEARRVGWLVAQSGGRSLGRGRSLRLDYCPEHAEREKNRRHPSHHNIKEHS
jgi:hypothetical protein